jgi:hypothetical protein
MGIRRVLVHGHERGYGVEYRVTDGHVFVCVGGSQKRVKGLNIVKVSSSTCRIDGGKN